jgi:hypothetical protein
MFIAYKKSYKNVSKKWIKWGRNYIVLLDVILDNEISNVVNMTKFKTWGFTIYYNGEPKKRRFCRYILLKIQYQPIACILRNYQHK